MDQNERIIDRIRYAKGRKDLMESGTQALRQSVLLPILQAAGWDIIELTEVMPDFEVGERSLVDYALQLEGKPKVLIGVCIPRTEPEDFDPPICLAAFDSGSDMAVLLSGLRWQFYVPDQTGELDDRLALSLDLLHDDETATAKRLIELLGRVNVADGSSRRSATELLESRQKAAGAEARIPDVWNELVEERDATLVQLIADRVEQQHGCRPADDMVKEFLSKNEYLFVDRASQDSTGALPSRTSRRRSARN
jgi:hypothetical protein